MSYIIVVIIYCVGRLDQKLYILLENGIYKGELIFCKAFNNSTDYLPILYLFAYFFYAMQHKLFNLCA